MVDTTVERRLIAEAWSSLTSGSEQEPHFQHPRLTGDSEALPSRFAALETATACVAAALMAAAALHTEGGTVDPSLDRGHVAAAVRSEQYFRSGGHATGMGFAQLSRFWRSADGWVRTHANYPWHRDALLRVLGVEDDPVAVAD